MEFRWNEEKNLKLIAERGISFEMIVEAIGEGGLLDDVQHSKRENQRLLIVEMNDYVYVVPYVMEGIVCYFLKTAFPCREAKKKYKG